ncbi:MAG: hypothetical protein AB4042_21325 [Leptolyngbyaceae cyanobacterium]
MVQVFLQLLRSTSIIARWPLAWWDNGAIALSDAVMAWDRGAIAVLGKRAIALFQ